MTKEKVPYNQVQGNYPQKEVLYNQAQGDYPQEEVPEIHSSEHNASDIGKAKSLYLPGSKANIGPSEESIEDANGLEHPKPHTLF